MSLLLAVYRKSMILVHFFVGQSCLIKIYLLNNILKSRYEFLYCLLFAGAAPKIHEIGTILICNPLFSVYLMTNKFLILLSARRLEKP